MDPVSESDSQGARRGSAHARRKDGRLRDELLKMATAMAAEPRPVTIPSLRAVARACGVSPTAVYRYFDSQSALTRSVLATAHEAFKLAVLSADDQAAAPIERLRLLATCYVQWGTSHPGLYQLLFESADQLGPDWAVVTAADEVTAHMVTLLASCQTGSAPDLAGERLWTGLHGLVSLRLHKPDHPWVAELPLEVDHLLRCLEVSRSSGRPSIGTELRPATI